MDGAVINLLILWFYNSWQEKQRAKIREKIDKCVKEKLVDFCNVLNIPITKTSMKKVSSDLTFSHPCIDSKTVFIQKSFLM